MSQRQQLERLMEIDRQIRAGLYPNAERIAQKLEVSKRVIYLDKAFMVNRLGTPGLGGYLSESLNLLVAPVGKFWSIFTQVQRTHKLIIGHCVQVCHCHWIVDINTHRLCNAEVAWPIESAVINFSVG